MGSESSTEEKAAGYESVRAVLSSSMGSLAQQNKHAYETLIAKAGEGFFEQHQTRGSLKALADELLKTMREGEEEDAD
jgi:hypothetical protein